MRTLIAISRRNWLIVWISLEINLISFLPILIRRSKYQETEASIKYFLAQAIGSRLLLIRRILIWSYRSLYMSIYIILAFSLLIKIGAFPCHFWYTSVMSSISWNSALILSTWQKLAPLTIIRFMLLTNKHILLPLAAINALVGGVIGINQSQLRTIIAYSSITHIGWIIRLIALDFPLHSITYFILYTILIAPIFILFNNLNTIKLTQLNKIQLNTKTTLIISLLILSLGGMPPLIGFFPKLITILILPSSLWIVVMLLIIGSLCNLYFYLNIMFSVLIRQSSINNINNKIRRTYLLTFIPLSLLWVPIIII